MNYADFLKQARRERGITAAAMAEAIGVSEDMVYRYESGRSEIGLRQIGRWAEACEIQLGEMFPSPRPRAAELQALVMALEDVEADDRSDLLEDFVRFTRRVSLIAKRREVIAVSGGREIPARGTPSREEPKIRQPIFPPRGPASGARTETDRDQPTRRRRHGSKEKAEEGS